MARPPTPVGTFGEINVKKISDDPVRWEARTRFRTADGSMKRPRRVGPTARAAERKLKAALALLADEVRGSQITGDTRFARVAELWKQMVEQEVREGTRSPNGARSQLSHLKNRVVPALGELQMREVTVMATERPVQKGRDERGYETAKAVRAVVSSVCDYAVRHGAISVNPVKSAKRLVRAESDKKEVRALTAEQRTDLLAKLEALAEKKKVDSAGRSIGRRVQVWQDLPDLVRAMLATGGRIGEVLALSGEDTDPTERTVALDHHLVPVAGEGITRVPGRKGGKPGLLLRVPSWSVPMWRRRKLASGGGPVFPSWRGTWLHPDNVISRLAEALAETELEWVTSHVFRKTVNTVLDEAGLPVTAQADQLGNTPAIVEQHYRARRVANEATAAALEKIITTAEEAK